MLRLMPVGDSMTIGSAGEHTWRYRLWRHLCATYDGPFDLVGPRDTLYDKAAEAPTSHDYADPHFPRGHLAGWGEGWVHMVPLVGDAVRSCRADVLLVSLGLIDLGFYTDPEQTATNARAFVARAREANPRIRLVVLPVVPNIRAGADPHFAEHIEHFNDLLAKATADLDEPGSAVLLASAPDSFDVHRDTYDGTHPNASGEHRVARAFADALYEGWGLGGPYTPTRPTRRASGREVGARPRQRPAGRGGPAPRR
ncbi:MULTISPECIES: GDSL-type esterase/lipase family protein [unclassified Streptomyces]|uniref:GDSL-type esterase/lipase family protein n=1 Tax=unclassified Streptomyces TaxID=2593676 RepID=UPI0019030A68|nr:GDSL-type esterase/lipase family protein [Streptomyces sp. HSG2]